MLPQGIQPLRCSAQTSGESDASWSQIAKFGGFVLPRSLSAALVLLLFGALPGRAVPEGLSSCDWQGIRAAYVVRQEAYLKSSKTDVFHQLGHSVAVSGETVVVGATGHGGTAAEAAYVFVRSGVSWSLSIEFRVKKA